MQVFEDKLLTIAIPTYNRPEKLKDQVSLLLKQVTDQVEILILDNCSSYNIYQLFSKEERQRIHIVTHKVNVGMPTNYIRCLEYATTDWVWTLSDDDPVLPDAINSVLSVIKNNSDAISICMNSTFDVSSYSFIEFVTLLKSHKIFSLHFWMSICIYNLSKLRPYISSGCNDSTTMIGPLLVVLEYLRINGKGRCVLTSQEIILSSNSITSWKKADFLIRLSLVYDIFRNDRKVLQKTLFYGMTNLSLYVLIQGIREKTVSNKDGKYILKELLFKSGYMYFINNFFILYLKAVCYLYLPISIMDRIITLKRNNYLMRKLNILFVFHVPFIAQNGGVERVTDILSRHLINRGYSVFYLSSEQRCSNFDFPVKQFYFPTSSYYSQKNIDYYNSFLLENKIDIVINQNGSEQAAFLYLNIKIEVM
ncbi:glycosyltransferase [Bacteroides fragilis]